jgi:hypothetical protein
VFQGGEETFQVSCGRQELRAVVLSVLHKSVSEALFPASGRGLFLHRGKRSPATAAAATDDPRNELALELPPPSAKGK